MPRFGHTLAGAMPHWPAFLSARSREPAAHDRRSCPDDLLRSDPAHAPADARSAGRRWGGLQIGHRLGHGLDRIEVGHPGNSVGRGRQALATVRTKKQASAAWRRPEYVRSVASVATSLLRV